MGTTGEVKDEPISDVIQWAPTYGYTSIGQASKT